MDRYDREDAMDLVICVVCCGAILAFTVAMIASLV
jgi:hypothetical protein